MGAIFEMVRKVPGNQVDATKFKIKESDGTTISGEVGFATSFEEAQGVLGGADSVEFKLSEKLHLTTLSRKKEVSGTYALTIFRAGIGVMEPATAEEPAVW